MMDINITSIFNIGLEEAEAPSQIFTLLETIVGQRRLFSAQITSKVGDFAKYQKWSLKNYYTKNLMPRDF